MKIMKEIPFEKSPYLMRIRNEEEPNLRLLFYISVIKFFHEKKILESLLINTFSFLFILKKIQFFQRIY